MHVRQEFKPGTSARSHRASQMHDLFDGCLPDGDVQGSARCHRPEDERLAVDLPAVEPALPGIDPFSRIRRKPFKRMIERDVTRYNRPAERHTCAVPAKHHLPRVRRDRVVLG